MINKHNHFIESISPTGFPYFVLLLFPIVLPALSITVSMALVQWAAAGFIFPGQITQSHYLWEAFLSNNFNFPSHQRRRDGLNFIFLLWKDLPNSEVLLQYWSKSLSATVSKMGEEIGRNLWLNDSVKWVVFSGIGKKDRSGKRTKVFHVK